MMTFTLTLELEDVCRVCKLNLITSEQSNDKDPP